MEFYKYTGKCGNAFTEKHRNGICDYTYVQTIYDEKVYEFTEIMFDLVSVDEAVKNAVGPYNRIPPVYLSYKDIVRGLKNKEFAIFNMRLTDDDKLEIVNTAEIKQYTFLSDNPKNINPNKAIFREPIIPGTKDKLKDHWGRWIEIRFASNVKYIYVEALYLLANFKHTRRKNVYQRQSLEWVNHRKCMVTKDYTLYEYTVYIDENITIVFYSHKIIRKDMKSPYKYGNIEPYFYIICKNPLLPEKDNKSFKELFTNIKAWH